MIRLLIADDERMEREALADIVMRRFEHEVTVEMAENGRKAADTAVPSGRSKPGAAWPSWLRKPRSRKPPRSRRPTPPGKGRATATHW